MSQPAKPTVFNFTPTTHHDTYTSIDPTRFNLSNRTVLITGASKGIGRATALSFARAGASRIVLAARSSLSSLETEILATAHAANHHAPKVLSLIVDISDLASLEAAAERVKSEFGGLDILINNAGFGGTWLKVAERDPEDWWRGWEVNLKGIYLTTRIMLPILLSTPDGLKTILNVSSIGAHLQTPGASAYQIAKLAILRFGEFVMTEYGDRGILCFGIHPGGVQTELSRGSLPKAMHGLLNDTPQLAGDSMVWLTALRREWLAGRYVSVTWDMEELAAKKSEIEEGDLLKVRMDVGV